VLYAPHESLLTNAMFRYFRDIHESLKRCARDDDVKQCSRSTST